jgi:hypothetical protein
MVSSAFGELRLMQFLRDRARPDDADDEDVPLTPLKAPDGWLIVVPALGEGGLTTRFPPSRTIGHDPLGVGQKSQAG